MENSRKRKTALVESSEETFEQATLRKEIAMADKHEMEVKVRRGELVESREIAAAVAEMCTTVKNAILAVPDRIALGCEGQPARVIRETMMAELRSALHALSSDLEKSAA